MSRENGNDITIELPRGQEYPSIYISGAITDPHMHPRNFDTLLPTQPSMPNGKAGLELYTRAALLSGISRGAAMPNEFIRYYDPEEPDQTKVEPYFITNIDKLRAFAHDISTESRIPMAIIVGVERESVGLAKRQRGFNTKYIEKFFASPEVKKLTKGLKIYGGNTTGGPDIQIPLEYIPAIAEVYHKHNPDKIVDLHLEDEAVGYVMSNLPKGPRFHIAHVSSRQELEAKMRAKELGINVSCEATFHHLALTDKTREAVGPYGCVKPTLKPEEDRAYLWDNIDEIEMFASDCAPHRKIDKVGMNSHRREDPAFGITNHDVFLPFFLGAMMDGRLSPRQLHDRIVNNPAERFNLPRIQRMTKFVLRPIDYAEASKHVQYGCSPLEQPDAPEQPKLVGKLIYIVNEVGAPAVHEGILGPSANPSYKNLIRA